MFEIIQSSTFKAWFSKLRDRQAIARINARLRRVSLGNIGDAKALGDGISELRIPYGPGYRIYFVHEGQALIVLLCGGDKSSQSRDIERAKTLAQEWRK
ncbi:MAG: type II toxin-antitoxin system RelE/ParE family toxin [Pseudomonadota bacterium]|nr:type II toxin-antitoxin system RelE/ParE family toxin [Pseudomonadota bacterium]